jgi:hypothetical protein
MASSYDNDLRLNEMATGDQSGAWGTVTNTNLELIGEALGYGTEAITTNANTHNTLIANGATDPGRSMFLKYTGNLDSNCTVTISAGASATDFTISKVWFIHNATGDSGSSGPYSLIITSGSGADVTIPPNHTKCIYTDGAGAGGAVVDAFAALSVVNLDVDGTANLDAVDIDGAVQLDATLTVGVDDTGYDVKFFGDTASAFMQWDASADDLILGGDAGLIVPEGQLTIASTAMTSSAADLNQLDGEVAKTAGKESIYVPATAMYPSTTNPCSDLTQVETTALRPDLKVLDFADGADDFAQFSVAFPKSWNEGTVTFQPFWTVTGTNTGTVAWQLAGVAITNDESINTAFGTQVATTALAFSGTSNDLMVSAESGAVTIAGSPAAADMCFFQINRDISADTQTGDARLLGVKLLFTTDAANDA